MPEGCDRRLRSESPEGCRLPRWRRKGRVGRMDSTAFRIRTEGHRQNDRAKQPDRAPVPVPESPLRLESATVQTLLWQRAGIRKPIRGCSLPHRSACPPAWHPKEQKVRRALPSSSAVRRKTSKAQVARVIRAALKTIHGDLPPGVVIHITSSEFEKSLGSRNRQPISAAAAVLASSALSGRVPDAIILGQVDETGGFKSSDHVSGTSSIALGKGNGNGSSFPPMPRLICRPSSLWKNPSFSSNTKCCWPRTSNNSST